MKNLTIQTRVLLLALVPVIVLTAFLTSYNLNQASAIGEEAVAGFSSDMEESKRQELQNYRPLQSLPSSISIISLGPQTIRRCARKRGRSCDSFVLTIREAPVIFLRMTPGVSM